MNSENRQKALPALDDLRQGSRIRRTRSGDGHSALYGWRLAVHLIVQPVVACALMADRMAAETGLLPRFLICEPPGTIGTRFHVYARGDAAALAAFGIRLRSVLDLRASIDGEAGSCSRACYLYPPTAVNGWCGSRTRPRSRRPRRRTGSCHCICILGSRTSCTDRWSSGSWRHPPQVRFHLACLRRSSLWVESPALGCGTSIQKPV